MEIAKTNWLQECIADLIRIGNDSSYARLKFSTVCDTIKEYELSDSDAEEVIEEIEKLFEIVQS